jgi:8-amino-7-oxononanoate synthase
VLGASRLISGHFPVHEKAEKFIANYHQQKAALLFNSGYDANLGLLSCIAQKNDTIVYDNLSHASIRDGIRLSNSRSFSFKHNNTEDLEIKIKQSSGQCFVCGRKCLFYGRRQSPITRNRKNMPKE